MTGSVSGMAVPTVSMLRQQSQSSTFYFLIDLQDVEIERHEAGRADLGWGRN